jgi:hypothetical protein
MAGRGPAPKDSAARTRRNKKKTEELAPVVGKGFDPLPKTYSIATKVRDGGDWIEELEEREYLATTREWYRTWAESPQAAKLSSTDRVRLRFVIAPLFDRVVRGELGFAGELRIQEASIGGTVLDRQRLGWKVPEGPKPDTEDPKPAGGVTPERRARLQRVK